MFIDVNFDGEEAIYIQLYKQIIEAIATSKLVKGETLPSVRQMADIAGINMHTVNKAYTILKDEGYITLSRRGATIVLDFDKIKAMDDMAKDLRTIVARAKCNNLTTEEIHSIVDGVIEEFNQKE